MIRVCPVKKLHVLIRPVLLETSKCMALRSWVLFYLTCPLYKTDSGYINMNIGFYPKSLRPYLRISCYINDHAC